ncbi:MAG: argininosuccinate lyase, partial [Candidatus Methylomirabilis sp.]|nr:argininosuccinate lyase [Deltaproteobacteria bacterium]
MDAVASRDFAAEFLAAGAILAAHLSRLSEDLILWSSQEFGFVEISDAYATGSSIMPQKKNADIAELTRGKTGRAFGNLIALLTTMKGLPMTYNKDLQEDKEPLFDTADALEAALEVFAGMMATLRVSRESMLRATERGHLTATDLADYLAKRGMPFRDAHHVVGRLVAKASAEGRALTELPLEALRAESALIGPDVYEAMSLRASLESRISLGGTATKQVKRQLRRVRALLGKS